ncbi:unnamed protein product [Candida verbasci]|uniref:Vps52 C-terminal domain-containing protein n=1 Tax=Candida verbasci TaxID=1227364 RepID=A0A9W4TRZ4_9ASCO|nr:unnamed protein product [Candida verbasci]
METVKQLLPINDKPTNKHVELQTNTNNIDFISYNHQLQEYKTKLKPIGTILEEFADILSTYSQEIANLEIRSRSLTNINHKIFEEVDKTILEKVIPPNYIKDTIGNINVDTIKFLTKAPPSDEINLLKFKAIESIRNKLILNIRQLRDGKPSQLVQKDMLDQKELYTFLYLNHQELAIQLRTAYFYTMRWYYRSNFSKYIYALEQIKSKTVDIFSHDYLQSRDFDTKAIPGQIAENFPFPKFGEFKFIQFLLALNDNIIIEYLFIAQYFYFGNEKDTKIEVIFKPVFELGKLFLKHLNTDLIGVLIILKYLQDMRKHKIPVLDDYCNQLSLYLWPLFSKLIDNACDVLQKEILKNKKLTLAPLNITQQFGQLYSNLLKLTPENNNIIKLRDTFEKYIGKVSTSLEVYSKIMM